MHTNTENPLVDAFARVVQQAVVELDIAYDDDTETSNGAAERFAQAHSLAFALVDESGPAGWPVYRFVGDVDDVEIALVKYTGDSYA